jgi:hypothetical protein
MADGTSKTTQDTATAGGFVFLSYAHADEEEVAPLVDWIEKQGVRVWWDLYLEDGSFTPMLQTKLEECCGVIAMLTPHVLRQRGSERGSAFVFAEITKARRLGKRITFCTTDPDEPPLDWCAVIQPKQQVFASDVTAFRSERKFVARIRQFAHACAGEPVPTVEDILRGMLAGGNEGASRGGERDLVGEAAVTAWYDAAPDLRDQALALSIAMLPDEPIEPVWSMAEDLHATMRPPEREGEPAEVRTKDGMAEGERLGARSRSQALAAVGAGLARATDPATGLEREVMRFADPERGPALIEHVWTERPDVREAVLKWIDSLLDQKGARLGVRVAASLCEVAQVRLDQVLPLVRPRWIESHNPAREYTATCLLASALVEDRNVVPIRDLLVGMARGGRIHRARALRMALGPIGLQRAEVAVEVLKIIGRNAFVDPRLNRIASSSFLFRGVKLGVAEAGEVGAEAGPEDSALKLDASPAASENGSLVEGEKADGASDPDRTSEEDVAASEEGVAASWDAGGSLPGARFLAALGDWIDEKTPDERKRRARQVPIYALMTIFADMPIHRDEAGWRLSLADLVGPISRWDDWLVERIVRGFVRAGVATPVAGSPYLPPRHLEHVFAELARRRHAESRRGLGGDGPDPFVVFAARVHAALELRAPRAGGYVTDGCHAHLTGTELAEIEGRA